MKKNDMYIFVWRRAMPAIQCAYRFFHSYIKETKKINYQFLSKHSKNNIYSLNTFNRQLSMQFRIEITILRFHRVKKNISLV